MSIPLFLAMTEEQFSESSTLPEHCAWMSVHFSPSGDGLCGLPAVLPPGSLIILDDSTPWSRHSLEDVCREAALLLRRTEAYGLLVDFERAPTPQTIQVCKALQQLCSELGCRFAAPEPFASSPGAAVFLSSLPCYVPRSEMRYPSVPFWADVTPSACRIILGKNQAEACEIPPVPRKGGFYHPELGSHYVHHRNENRVVIELYQTTEDVQDKLLCLEKAGAELAVAAAKLWKQFAV